MILWNDPKAGIWVLMYFQGIFESWAVLHFLHQFTHMGLEIVGQNSDTPRVKILKYLIPFCDFLLAAIHAKYLTWRFDPQDHPNK